jgi:hypothetical protein
MDDQMPERPQLFKEIMGQFDLVDTVEVFRKNHPNKIELHLTVMHEEAHRKAISSTTYGKVQGLLATILRESSNEGSPVKAEWGGQAAVLLDQTIQFSWFTHEGFAVSRERAYGKLFYPDYSFRSLPQDYEKAYRRYEHVMESLPRNLKIFGIVAARAIAEASLNTDILSWLAEKEFTPETVKRAVEETERPDRRLEALLKAVRAGKLADDFGADYESQLRQLFNGTPLAQFTDVSSAVANLFTRITPETIGLVNPFDQLATTAFHEYFSLIAPALKIVNPLNLGEEVVAFHNKVVEQFEQNAVTIPRAKVGTLQDGALKGTDVKFRPQMRPWKFVDQSQSEDITTGLLNDDLRFVIQLGRSEELSANFGSHYAIITALRLEPIGKPDGQKPQPYGAIVHGQYAFAGPPDYVHRLTKRLRSRSLQVIIGLSAVSFDDWTVADDISAIAEDIRNKGDVLIQILPQFDTPATLHLLSVLEERGIKDCKVIGLDHQIMHLAHWMPGSMVVVVKLSTALPWILKTHGGAFPDYIYRALAEKTNVAELGFLASIPDLEERGFLWPV